MSSKPPSAAQWEPRHCVLSINPEGFTEVYLRCDVFLANIHLVLAPTAPQWQEWCRRVCDTLVEELPTLYACAMTFSSPQEGFGKRYVIYLSKTWSTESVLVDDVLTLCHEATHTSRAILKAKGVPLGSESEEVVAYHQEFVFGQLWAALRKPPVQGEWQELLDARAVSSIS